MACHRREDQPRREIELQPLAAGLRDVPPARRLLRLPGALERHRRLRGERRELRQIRLSSVAGALAADSQQAERSLARDQRRGEQEAGAIERAQRACGVARVHHRLRQAQRPAPVGEELRHLSGSSSSGDLKPRRDALRRPPFARREDRAAATRPSAWRRAFELASDLLRLEHSGDAAAEVDHPFELAGAAPQLPDARPLHGEPEATSASAMTPKNQGRCQNGAAIATGSVADCSPALAVERGLDGETVRTRRDRRILRVAACPGVDPVAVHAVEPVAEAQPVRRAQVDRREVDFEAVVARREPDRRVEGDRRPSTRTSSRIAGGSGSASIACGSTRAAPFIVANQSLPSRARMPALPLPPSKVAEARPSSTPNRR